MNTKTTSSSPPRFTVIIPIFNGAKSVKRAIDSVLSQTFLDFELLAVNDGSTDSTIEILNGYNDKRLRILSHKNNRGQNAALNLGLAVGKGMVFSFLDDDDIWLSTYLFKVNQAFESDPSIDVVYTRLVNGPKWSIQGRNIYGDVLNQGTMSAMISVNVRKRCFNLLGNFDESYSMSQDDDFCFKLARHFHIKLIPERLALIIGDSNSMTSKRVNVAKGFERLYKDYRADILKYCGYRTLSKHHFILAELYVQSARYLKGIQKYILAHYYLLKKPGKFLPITLKNVFFWEFSMLISILKGLKYLISHPHHFIKKR